MTIKVAGVTFCNDPQDGGKPRQEILKTLPEIISVRLLPTYFKGEKAIKCMEKSTRQIIGWIPKSEIQNIWGTSEMTGFVQASKDTYGVRLEPMERPSHNLYMTVKIACQNNNRPLPAYDARAYKRAIAQLRKEKLIP